MARYCHPLTDSGPAFGFSNLSSKSSFSNKLWLKFSIFLSFRLLASFDTLKFSKTTSNFLGQPLVTSKWSKTLRTSNSLKFLYSASFKTSFIKIKETFKLASNFQLMASKCSQNTARTLNY